MLKTDKASNPSGCNTQKKVRKGTITNIVSTEGGTASVKNVKL
jgi:hypothetical protein